MKGTTIHSLYEDLAKINAKDFKKMIRKVSSLVNYLKLVTIGPNSITPSQMVSIVADGWMKQDQPIDFSKTIPGIYIRTLGLLGGDSVPETVRDRSIKFLSQGASNYIDAAGQKLKNDTHSIIMGENHFGQKTRQILLEGVQAGDSNHEMAEKLAQVFGRFTKNWQLVVQTELAHASNLGAIDTILSKNKNKTIDEIIVYKQTARDQRMCETCKKLWHWEKDFSIPKVYKMSELVANNTGLNLKDSRPSIQPQHPNCRCLLLQIPHGYGFRSDGHLVYYGQEYSEYNKQKS